MENYFEEFKMKIKNRMRIPKSIVDEYYDEIYFIVDTDSIYAQVFFLRIAWLRSIPYKENVDEVTKLVTTLVAKEIGTTIKKNGTCEIVIVKLSTELRTPKKGKERKRISVKGGHKDEEKGMDNL